MNWKFWEASPESGGQANWVARAAGIAVGGYLLIVMFFWWWWDAEPDTLIYAGSIVADFPDSDPWAAGDLLFVMACTDAAAAERHAMDPNHLALGEKLRNEGVEIENAEATHYRTTGRGFLWR